MRTKLFNTLKIITTAFVISIGFSYVYAWTAPTANPPAGNVSAPINTSATAQTKAGALTVGSLDAGSGNINTIGTITGLTLIANSVTTNILKIPGAVVGQVLTAVDANGTVEWKSPAAIAAAGGGGGLPQESFFRNPAFNGTAVNTFLVPDGVTTVLLEAVGGGGSGSLVGAYAWAPSASGNAGGQSSAAVSVATMYAPGGAGGTLTGAGAPGTGVGGFTSSSLFSTSPYGTGGTGAYPGGNGGYVKGLLTVTPGSTLVIKVGVGGAAVGGISTAGGAGFVHLTYLGASATTPLQKCANAGGQAVDGSGNCTYVYGSASGSGWTFANIFGFGRELRNGDGQYICANVGGHASWTYLSATTETHATSCGDKYGLEYWAPGFTFADIASCGPPITVVNSVTCKVPM